MNFVVDPQKFSEPTKLRDFFLQDLEEVRQAAGVQLPLLAD
jgi:hypothetical protein